MQIPTFELSFFNKVIATIWQSLQQPKVKITISYSLKTMVSIFVLIVVAKGIAIAVPAKYKFNGDKDNTKITLSVTQNDKQVAAVVNKKNPTVKDLQNQIDTLTKSQIELVAVIKKLQNEKINDTAMKKSLEQALVLEKDLSELDNNIGKSFQESLAKKQQLYELEAKCAAVSSEHQFCIDYLSEKQNYANLEQELKFMKEKRDSMQQRISSYLLKIL